MSLYRKYRPKIFADVYGQEHVVHTLEQATENDKFVHAYLFAGSRGTGKTSVARILAKLLMTHDMEDQERRKQIEKGVDDGSIVDLLEIDAASNRGIDDIRELIEKIQFSPVIAGAKVYIIDEVHMLTKEAFNALLKTLEEPPPYAYFILATTELNKIPETVQSRCQCFPFRHIREEDIVRRLQFIADQEHISVDREALRTIARLSEGGMRDAISLLDQLRSMDKITAEDVRHRTGATGQEYVEDMLQAIAKNDTGQLLADIARIEDAGVPLDAFVRQMLRRIREALHESIRDGKDLNEHLGMQECLLETVRNIRISPVPGLVLEAALLKLCVSGSKPAPQAKKTPVAAPKATRQQESKLHEEKKDAPTAPAAEQETESVRSAAIEAPDVSIETLRKAWPDVLQETTPPSVKISLKNGRVADVQAETVILTFTSAFHRDKVRATDASRAVESVLQKIFKRSLRLQCDLEQAEAANGSQQDVVNLADAAAEIF